MKKFVIIDGNALVHRSYHALPKTLRSSKGELTNAVFGFTSILLGILEQERPDYLAAAFDMKGPTFRDALFAQYKATRVKTDDELIGQFPRVFEVLEVFSIPIFAKEGFEADDYLGIVTTKLRRSQSDIEILIVTGDQDALQLVGEGVTVVAPIRGYTKVKRYDRVAVKEKTGVWPEQVPDYKGLAGDISDNIPGVPGIGDKTAIRLLEEWGSMEGIYEHLGDVQPERIRELLRKNEDSARLSKKLATIVREDDISVDLEASKIHNFDINKVHTLFAELSFKSHLARLEKLSQEWDKRRLEEKQGSLF